MLNLKVKTFSFLLFPLIIFIILIFVSRYYTPGSLFTRFLFWNLVDANDYKKFPYAAVHNTESKPFYFEKSNTQLTINQIEYNYKGKRTTEPFEDFLKLSDTTAFIVIKDDKILYEDYFNGRTRDSFNMSFSLSKSFISAMVGIAIDDGYIKSIDQPVTDFIPELKNTGYDNITIKHLLTMSSGVKYKWLDGVKSYYSPDIRQLLMNLSFEAMPGQYFNYNSYDPQLLGLVLERAANRPVSQYLEEKVWKTLGMEYDASWSIDSNEKKFEKMDSGMSARAIDFAKLGRLYLNGGKWDGKQIISQEWVKESTTMELHLNMDYYTRRYQYPFLSDQYYKYFWWGFSRGDSTYDFYAEGAFGQVLYVSPSKNAIVIRMGTGTGKVDSWPQAIYENIISIL